MLIAFSLLLFQYQCHLFFLHQTWKMIKKKNLNIEKGLVQNLFIIIQGRSNNVYVEYRIEIVAKRKQFP